MIENYLVFQAKSFYYAYIALEQINMQCEDRLMYCLPTIVNGAFSSELSLKTILAKNKIKYENEHNILNLFMLLPNTFQIELLGNLTKKAPEYQNMDKFVDELVFISNAFIDWRYAFESKTVPAIDMRFLSAFANAAICTMLSHYDVSIECSVVEEKMEDEINEMIRENREQSKKKIVAKLHKK